MDEVWKDIEGFEGYYQISNLGRVKSLPRKILKNNGVEQTIKEKIKMPTKNDRGYYSVRLCMGGDCKTVKIHTLVAKAFIPNSKNLNEVNHIDGDKSNNCVTNLEWFTRADNIQHAFDNGLNSTIGEKNPRSILSEKDIINIRLKRNNGENLKDVYEDYKDIISISGFRGIWNNRTWKHIQIGEWHIMTKTIYPATLLCDFYKVSHKDQYPKGTQYVYSTFTPRSNKYFPKADKVVVFGIQAFIKKYLINYFNENFFNRPRNEVVEEYKRIIKFTLGQEEVDASHIEALHEFGHLPIKIRAIKEGTRVPVKVPMMTIENTDKRFFWVTNYLETLLSNEVWLPMTSATIAHTYRQLLDEYALKTVGTTDGVAFQGHDFSMRGIGAFEASVASGAGHLLSFFGTDTIPAISYHEEYYNADIEREMVGTSIPATEHSVMCAYGDENEFELFKHLMTEVYPTGFFSVVSDTWDFWKVVGEYLPKLKEEVMNRDGRVVIRPDSGDPVLILIGDPNGETDMERKGLIECLWGIFGGTVTEKGYKLLDPHIGAIYGDSITLERAEAIVKGLEAKGFASTNVVFGIGSFTYQYNTRDTFGFAVKATHAVVNEQERMLFKDPKTDDGTKRSQRGRVAVVKTNNELTLVDGLTKEQYDADFAKLDEMEEVFCNGELLRDQSLAEIRNILHKEKSVL